MVEGGDNNSNLMGGCMDVKAKEDSCQTWK